MLATLSADVGHYREVATLLWRHGHGPIAAAAGLENLLGDDDEHKSTPQSLARDIEELGAAYIKLGQIASTRHDVIPADYCDALSRLQDDVEPVPFAEIRERIEAAFGRPIESLFATFDDDPLATASLGQVHAATLPDGSDVVVKVQRPGIADEARAQLRSLERLAAVVDQQTEIGKQFRFGSLVGAVDYVMSAELDYRREASSLNELNRNLSEFGAIVLPRPVKDLVAEKVLVMERLRGEPFSSVGSETIPREVRSELAETLTKAYLKQILLDGLFHADPHPGNLLLLPENRLGLIDGGMTVSMDSTMRRRVARLLLSLAEREGTKAATAAIELGIAEEEFQPAEFRQEVARIVANLGFGDSAGLSLGQLIVEMLDAAGRHGLILPYEVLLLSKAFLQIESTLLALDPNVQPDETIRGFTVRLLADRVNDQISPGKLAAKALDASEFAAELPSRLNKIVRRLADNELRLDIDAVDEQRLLDGIEKIANRITAGLIVAAMIIGASLIMNIETSWTLLGYPALAILFFLMAACVGCVLVYKALLTDG